MTKQMKTVSVNAFVYYEKPDEWDEDQSGITFSNFDFSSVGLGRKVLVNSQVITLEIPVNYDPRPQQIANLQAAKRQARADCTALETSIDCEISQLQALEMS